MGDYTLCVTDKSNKCVKISADAKTYIISYESTASTETMYESFNKSLREKGFAG